MPRMPNTTAKPWPMVAATSVARALPIHMARSARNTRPPSMGKAGIMLNRTRMMLAPATLAAMETAGISILREIFRVEARAEPEQQHRGDDHVHGGAGERHDELLARLLGHLLHAGDAAERPQRHVAGVHAIAPRGEHMAELMQKHAQEDEDDEDRALPGGFGAALAVINRAEPNEEQEEGDVDADRRSADGSKRERPAHGQRRVGWRFDSEYRQHVEPFRSDRKIAVDCQPDRLKPCLAFLKQAQSPPRVGVLRRSAFLSFTTFLDFTFLAALVKSLELF